MANETMTASDTVMSDGQIDTLANSLRDAARKHRDEAPRDAAQEALGTPNLGMVLWTQFRKLVEQISKRIVHVVTVDLARTPKQSLDACGRRQYVNDDVVAAMPRSEVAQAPLIYFVPRPECYDENGWMSPQKLAEEYMFNRLKPDPQRQIEDNTANPEFADKTPNACQWVDADGNYCYAAFDRWDGGRRVDVRRGRGWRGGWSFAGVPQESSASAV